MGAADLAKACWAGGTTQFYVNPTLPAGVTYEAVRDAISPSSPHSPTRRTPGRQVILKVMKKEELRNVDGTDSLHPNRSGDVVVVSRPPYQFDAATAGQTIAFSQFFGQHGYLPDLVDLKRNINMHGTFVAAGPGIQHFSAAKTEVRAIDVAPTMAFVLGIPGPQNARGKILFSIIKGNGNFREITILNISDWHAQIPPGRRRPPTSSSARRAPDRDGSRADLLDRGSRVPRHVVRRLPQARPATVRCSWPAATRSAAPRRRSRTRSATSRSRRS